MALWCFDGSRDGIHRAITDSIITPAVDTKTYRWACSGTRRNVKLMLVCSMTTNDW
jgi:hypothetical protein